MCVKRETAHTHRLMSAVEFSILGVIYLRKNKAEFCKRKKKELSVIHMPVIFN